MSETDLQNRCRKVASECGATLFRNTVGTAVALHGGVVKYGLGNGSPDLVGFIPVVITPQMVGQEVAIFCGVEIKLEGKKPRPDQYNFLNTLAKNGCVSTWVDSDAQLQQLIYDVKNGLYVYRGGVNTKPYGK